MMTIKISADMVQKADHFARSKRSTSYPRFGETGEEQLERLYAGKLGELIGQEALRNTDIAHQCLGKLDVVDRMGYRDTADCIIYPGTEDEKTVDFKTAWKSYQTRILIPVDMFISQRKDLYVGIKIDLVQKEAMVHGYQTRQYINDTHSVKDFGEGPAFWVYLNELRPLEELRVGMHT